MASYAKLRDGSWGVRGAVTEIAPGRTVTVTTKAGASKTETVGRIVWSGDGIVLATIASKGETRSRTRQGGNVCAACGKGGSLVVDMEDGMPKHFSCCDMPPDGY